MAPMSYSRLEANFFFSRRLATKNSNFFGQLEAESRWQLFFVSGIFFQVQKNSNKELRKKLFDFSCVAERSEGSLNVLENFVVWPKGRMLESLD